MANLDSDPKITPTNPEKSAETDSEISIAWDYQEEKKHHSKNWYLVLGLAFVAMIAVALFLLKDILFTVVLVVLIIALIFYLRRSDFSIKYALSKEHIYIDSKAYPFDEFKSFGLQKNLNQSFTIILIPHKRFGQGLSLNFPDELGEEIVDFIGAILPMQKIELNLIDQIIQKIGL